MITVSKGPFEFSIAADSNVYVFKGPGLGRFNNTVAFAEDSEAHVVLGLLHAAYEAGKAAKLEELRKVLGVYDTPWGVMVGP